MLFMHCMTYHARAFPCACANCDENESNRNVRLPLKVQIRSCFLVEALLADVFGSSSKDYEWMNVWIDGWMIRLNDWLNGWMNIMEWMNEYVFFCVLVRKIQTGMISIFIPVAFLQSKTTQSKKNTKIALILNHIFSNQMTSHHLMWN